MITFLRGILQAKSPEYLVVETGGIGFLLFAPRPLIREVGSVGEHVLLHTKLVVREDAMVLYGFGSAEQRDFFDTLLSVSGVGPRIALALLSAASPEEILLAVARKDAARLAQVPGVGKKMAERLILELKNKLKVPDLPMDHAGASTPEIVAMNSDLLDLLMSLGYRHHEASEAIAALPPDAPPSLEERLRLALKHFGRI